MDRTVIALEARLRGCKNVRTIGVRPNFSDYAPEDADAIRGAERIYYPTAFYADLFDTMGKPTFPSYHTYKCTQDKIKQTALFNLLDIPHPRTRVFYSTRPEAKILARFDFPFIAKVARGSAMGRGVFLIQNLEQLRAYLRITHPAYIQEYLPGDRDIRAVVIGDQVVHVYWRLSPPGEFRSNIAVGGTVGLDPIPREATALALETAKKCRFDDVGIDICFRNRHFWVLEANMKYGKEGFHKAGIDYLKLMEALIAHGRI
jgi:ribosomal protein S6--L-glutamate ligase